MTTMHPLSDYGHHRLPHWLWRRSRLAFGAVARLRDTWLVLTGRCSLHQAWQRGLTDGTRSEYQRIVVNGGDIAGKVWTPSGMKPFNYYRANPDQCRHDERFRRDGKLICCWCETVLPSITAAERGK